MKNTIFLLLLLLLVGCEAGDPRPKIYPAKVITLNNNICVLVPAVKGEFMTSLEIEGGGSAGRLRKYFTEKDHPLYLYADKCAPLFDYPFESGRAYGIAIQTATAESLRKNSAGRVFSTSFSIWKDADDKLRIGDIR